MTDQDFTTIYAITLEAPKRIGTMIASTPTGRRGMFYKTCTEMKFNQDEAIPPVNTKQLGYVYDSKHYDRAQAEGWKEFHYPSMCNPEWSEQMERELKSQFDEVSYEHEVLAEFGTETIGVFNKDYIDEAASKGYRLQDGSQSNSPIAIGIDWDIDINTNLQKDVPFKSNLIDEMQVNCGKPLRAFITNFRWKHTGGRRITPSVQ